MVVSVLRYQSPTNLVSVAKTAIPFTKIAGRVKNANYVGGPRWLVVQGSFSRLNIIKLDIKLDSQNEIEITSRVRKGETKQ